jgi:hypothetical protein
VEHPEEEARIVGQLGMVVDFVVEDDDAQPHDSLRRIDPEHPHTVEVRQGNSPQEPN